MPGSFATNGISMGDEGKPMMRLITVLTSATLAVAACSTSPTGRSQLILFPDTEVNQMGAAAFTELKRETPQATDATINNYVRCVADAITDVLPTGQKAGWEVAVFNRDEVNAFALPGRKIGVYAGMLGVANNQHRLAAVIGHEVAHVLARHSNERLSTAYATEAGLNVLGTISGGEGAARNQVFAVLGVGAQVGVLLPFGRAQESEADNIGVDLMARAGFDPRESIELWREMSRQGGGKPPQILSTHPSDQTRIANLTALMNRMMPLYEQARAAGRRPDCRQTR